MHKDDDSSFTLKAETMMGKKVSAAFSVRKERRPCFFSLHVTDLISHLISTI